MSAGQFNVTGITALSQTRHAGLGWYPPTASSALFVEEPYIPLALVEIDRFSIRMPIVLHRTAGRVQPVIPIGAFGEHPTYFTNERGQWRVPHVPGALLLGPFSCKQAGKHQLILVDTAKLGAVKDDSARLPLFEEGAGTHPETQAHIERVMGWARGERQAARAAQALANAGLLVRWSEKDETLFRVDAEALAAVSEPVAAQLHRLGALRLAHLCTASLGTVSVALRQTPIQKEEPANDFLAALQGDW
ncbi:MAG: SapC family protein [Pseudomonadota bacterium]